MIIWVIKKARTTLEVIVYYPLNRYVGLASRTTHTFYKISNGIVFHLDVSPLILSVFPSDTQSDDYQQSAVSVIRKSQV